MSPDFHVGKTIQELQARFAQHKAQPGKAHWKTNNYQVREAQNGFWTEYESAVWEQHVMDMDGGKTALENKSNAVSEKTYARIKELGIHDPC